MKSFGRPNAAATVPNISPASDNCMLFVCCCRYTENQFDSEFINVLREACFSYIQRQKDVSLGAIATFIRGRGFSKVRRSSSRLRV